MIRLLCLAIGYLFGLFQTSYILGRVHGIDIREYGSHNAGTTNMLRTMGLKAGLLTYTLSHSTTAPAFSVSQCLTFVNGGSCIR